MHIPDGYMSPQTCAATYAIMIPVWAAAARFARRGLRTGRIPLLAMGAAFSFVIMLFNIPIPGGSTGHAVGAVILAILVGPWAACIALSCVLAVQALFFGDGGVLAFASNCFNMAFIMPFTGYAVYRLIAWRSAPQSRRHLLGAALGGYVGITLAALTTAVMFGIQPLLAHDAAGHALYSPYPLEVALPAMVLEHLLLFGPLEAVVTMLVIRYMQRNEPAYLISGNQRQPTEPEVAL
ncbi:MAG: cobalt transporter CbiM [bacterium]|nr:cobalt transporter CbiM [bacterium]